MFCLFAAQNSFFFGLCAVRLGKVEKDQPSSLPLWEVKRLEASDIRKEGCNLTFSAIFLNRVDIIT